MSFFAILLVSSGKGKEPRGGLGVWSTRVFTGPTMREAKQRSECLEVVSCTDGRVPVHPSIHSFIIMSKDLPRGGHGSRGPFPFLACWSIHTVPKVLKTFEAPLFLEASLGLSLSVLT